MDLGFGKRPGAAPAAGGSSDLVKETTTAAFKADVIDASKNAVVLVDFWADWCGPCKQLAPVLEKVVHSYAGKVRLVKLNVDQHPSIPGQLRIQSLPTVYAFRDGRPLDGFMGLQPESAIKAFIDRILGEDTAADIEAALADAEKAFEGGDLQGAAQVYAAILQEDQQNVAALAGLARCYLKSGDVARAEQTLSLVPPDKQSTSAVASVKAAIDLAKRGAGSASDLAGLETRIAADPADHQARIDLAMAFAARGDKEKAVEQLLESFRRDRNWNEQAARKQLVQLFEAWGPKDPATLDGRRRLSSLMFA
jgi:putative thioredoxin